MFTLKIKLIHRVQGEMISVQCFVSIFNMLLATEKRGRKNLEIHNH